MREIKIVSARTEGAKRNKSHAITVGPEEGVEPSRSQAPRDFESVNHNFSKPLIFGLVSRKIMTVKGFWSFYLFVPILSIPAF